MNKLRTLLLILILAVPAPAGGQSAAGSIAVTLVEVPVTVLDRAGNPVRGLTAANFELLDGGKRQQLSHFEAIDLTRISSQDQAVNPAARRNFLLMFDLANADPISITRGRDAARAFVGAEVRSLDRVAVAVFRVERGVQLLTGFTSDKDVLQAAIDTLGHPKLFQVRDPLFLAATRSGNSEGGSTNRAIDAEAIFMEEMRELDRLQQQGNDDYHRGRVRSQLKTFAGFARILDRVKGRKHVILLSEGFDARLIQGRDVSATTESQADATAVVSGEIWKVDSDQRYGSTEAAREVSTMAEVFRRSDVVLHAVDIKGLRGDVDAKEGFRRTSSESLFLLTEPTGGQFFKNANDLGGNLQKLMRQQDVVYLLAFPAKAAGSPGAFHPLRVKLNNVPGGRVFHRAGYYEPSEKMTVLEQTLTAADILMNEIPRHEVSITAMAAPFRVAEEKPVVPVVIEIPGRKLAEGETGSVNVELFVYAFDGSNVVHDFLHQRIELDLVKIGGELLKNGVKFYGALRLDPGRYSIRTLVRVQESGRAGFDHLDLEIPAEGTASILPPMVWEEGQSWIMVKGRPRSAAEVDYPFQLASETFIPSAQPELVSGRTYKVALFTYGIQREGMDLGAVIRSADGSTRPAPIALTGIAPADGSGANKLLLSFTPAGLTPGSYQLEISIAQKAQNVARTASVSFIVSPAS